MRDEVITGGKTRGCRSPGFRLPWQHVRPVEGRELSAVEGGGGTREGVGGARRGTAPPGGLFSLPALGSLSSCTVLLAGPGWTAAGLGSGGAGWWARNTARGCAPWQAVRASARDMKSCFCGCAMEEPELPAGFLLP